MRLWRMDKTPRCIENARRMEKVRRMENARRMEKARRMENARRGHRQRLAEYCEPWLLYQILPTPIKGSNYSNLDCWDLSWMSLEPNCCLSSG